MDNSILLDIKKLIGGIDIEDNYYDPELILYINSALAVLKEDLGIGNSGFRITGYDETWNELLNNSKNFDDVVTYVHFSVKLKFDPPASSYGIESINKIISESAWRLTNRKEIVSE